jgi:flagellar basal-body rod modification protein FlgD
MTSNAIGAGPAAQPAAGQEIASNADRLASKEVFLQLLVAQLRNQNPLNPANGVEFMSQLAQFSQLEQAMSSRRELEAIHKLLQQVVQPAAGGGQ